MASSSDELNATSTTLFNSGARSRNDEHSATALREARAMGKPYKPVLIAGNATDSIPFATASSRQAR